MCDEQSRINPSYNKIEYDIWLEEPLRNIGEVYDELDITNGKVTVIRRIGVNENLSLYVLDVEEILVLEDINLKTFDKGTYMYIKEYESLKYYCKYITNNEYANIFATQNELKGAVTELNTSFNQTAKEITAEVRKKVGNDEIISKINQSAGQVYIEAGKIDLNGLVTANGNFKILKDGSMEALNGIFRGNIYMDDGNKIIGGDGMMTNLQYSSVGQYQGYSLLGFCVDFVGENYNIMYSDTAIDIYIPDNFTIKSAYLTIQHTPVVWSGYDTLLNKDYECNGYSREIKLYKGKQNFKFSIGYGSECNTEMESYNLYEIQNAFGEKTYTPQNTSGTSIEIRNTIDIKNFVDKGNTKLILRTTNNIPSNLEEAASQTGMARAIINIFGYYKLIKEDENE